MAAARESQFRPEIEGLRAVASLLVAVFHIWLGRVSGGVDVFFVVSSFLITTSLVSQVERTGTIDFARFWGRLVRRLIPAAFVVLLAVIVAVFLLLPPSRWRDTIEGVAAAAVYLENWYLAHQAVDYLAQHTPPNSVMHFWALSVQGQFYVLWPFLMLGTVLLARRFGLAFRSLLTPVLGIVFAVSLAWSVHLTNADQPVAYFNTFARIWEFCIGAVLAVWIGRVRLPNAVRLVAGWAGLLAILGCGILFQVSRVFPGFAALWPTVAGALVVLAGTTRGFGADKLLASRPLVYLGGISYSLYLWHFPILVVVKAYMDPHPIGLVTGLLILGSAVLLAALTQRFIEVPLREEKDSAEPRWRPFALGAGLLAPIALGLLAWTLHYKALRAEHRDPGRYTAATHPGAAVLEPGAIAPAQYGAPVYPGPLLVYDDHEQLRGHACRPPAHATVPGDCVRGDPDGRFVLGIIGNSHSSHWLPALEIIAAREHWRLQVYSRNNCPFHLGKYVSDAEIPVCLQWNQNVIKALVRNPPDAVYMASTREMDGDEFVPEGYVLGWRALERANIPVIAIRDNPRVTFDAPDCVELHGPASPWCMLERARVLEVPSPTATLKDPPANVRFIDLSDYFCDARTCPMVVGNVMVYRHLSHITATYARTLEPMLSRELERVLPLERPADTMFPSLAGRVAAVR
jgi:peptidoglycan/LPS O-acetylase OafA/YrhL